MQKEFWQEKWRANEIGFHLEGAHPLLQKYHAQVFAKNAQVFVPLCGKTNDLVFLVEQGYQVIGNELSEKAVRAFFAENYGLEHIESRVNGETIKELYDDTKLANFTFSNINIFQGDFFQLQSGQLANSNCIYDRAALIALPQMMRIDYVAHLKKLLTQANLLLVTLEYNQSKMAGPPFSVSAEEVTSLFSWAKIEKLYRKNIIEKEPRFKSKGLEQFFEAAYKITW